MTEIRARPGAIGPLSMADERDPKRGELCWACLGTGMRYQPLRRVCWPCPLCDGAPHPASDNPPPPAGWRSLENVR